MPPKDAEFDAFDSGDGSQQQSLSSASPSSPARNASASRPAKLQDTSFDASDSGDGLQHQMSLPSASPSTPARHASALRPAFSPPVASKSREGKKRVTEELRKTSVQKGIEDWPESVRSCQSAVCKLVYCSSDTPSNTALLTEGSVSGVVVKLPSGEPAILTVEHFNAGAENAHAVFGHISSSTPAESLFVTRVRPCVDSRPTHSTLQYLLVADSLPNNVPHVHVADPPRYEDPVPQLYFFGHTNGSHLHATFFPYRFDPLHTGKKDDVVRDGSTRVAEIVFIEEGFILSESAGYSSMRNMAPKVHDLSSAAAAAPSQATVVVRDLEWHGDHIKVSHKTSRGSCGGGYFDSNGHLVAVHIGVHRSSDQYPLHVAVLPCVEADLQALDNLLLEGRSVPLKKWLSQPPKPLPLVPDGLWLSYNSGALPFGPLAGVLRSASHHVFWRCQDDVDGVSSCGEMKELQFLATTFCFQLVIGPYSLKDIADLDGSPSNNDVPSAKPQQLNIEQLSSKPRPVSRGFFGCRHTEIEEMQTFMLAFANEEVKSSDIPDTLEPGNLAVILNEHLSDPHSKKHDSNASRTSSTLRPCFSSATALSFAVLLRAIQQHCTLLLNHPLLSIQPYLTFTGSLDDAKRLGNWYFRAPFYFGNDAKESEDVLTCCLSGLHFYPTHLPRNAHFEVNLKTFFLHLLKSKKA